jgi:hypothetical protein
VFGIGGHGSHVKAPFFKMIKKPVCRAVAHDDIAEGPHGAVLQGYSLEAIVVTLQLPWSDENVWRW